MMQFFRSGIYEYDKRKLHKLTPCERCGAKIAGTKRKRFCLPCKADRYDETVAANRIKYKQQKRASP